MFEKPKPATGIRARVIAELREQLGREPTESEITEAVKAFARAAIAEMRKSARQRRGRIKTKAKPPLEIPPGCVDVTAQHAGKTIVIVGNPFPRPKDR